MKQVQDELTEDIELTGWKFSAQYGILGNSEGKDVVLEPRLSKLMHVLFQHANKIVSRNYLLSNIWQDTVVNEESLTRAIADLRRTLKENFNTAITIETVPKRGYKLNLQPVHKTYALKLKIKHPVRYGIVAGLLLIIYLLWYTGHLKFVAM